MYLILIASAFLMLLFLSPPELETRCHFQEVYEETRPCCIFRSHNLNLTTDENIELLLSCEELQTWIISNSSGNFQDQKLSCYLTQICRTQETLWIENDNIQTSLVQNCDESQCECNLTQACRGSEIL